MIEKLENKIKDLEEEILSLEKLLKIEEKKNKLKELEKKISEPDFWKNKDTNTIEELKSIKSDIEDVENLKEKINHLKEFLLIYDPSYENDLNKEFENFNKNLEDLRTKILFSEKFDNSSCIVEINSGAGGVEACDWANMLFRMYCRWAEDKGFKIVVIDELKNEEAGLKNITFIIEGFRAYGFLKSEKGIHRLVRISPFDANKRRHTSFASVSVIPKIESDIDIEIRQQDLKIETFRASGKGGQHVNRTDSAVRITHIPTGIVVSCQNERSQHQNKELALNILRSKLYELKEEERQKALENIRGQKRKIEWGSQIRSYVLYPYLLVKDHRTGYETSGAWSVLDGKIDDFIFAYLRYILNKKN